MYLGGSVQKQIRVMLVWRRVVCGVEGRRHSYRRGIGWNYGGHLIGYETTRKQLEVTQR